MSESVMDGVEVEEYSLDEHTFGRVLLQMLLTITITMLEMLLTIAITMLEVSHMESANVRVFSQPH